MINTGEILRTIMKEYSLNQTTLSRAINCDYSNVSRWINGVRVPDINTLEHILNTFGYELDVTLKEKKGFNKSKDFYKEKSFEQLKKMTKEELGDYIFVTQTDETIAKICNINIDILKFIPLNNQIELIKNKLPNNIPLNNQTELINNNINLFNIYDILGIYFKLNNMYNHVETQMVSFIEYVKYHLKNNSIIDKDVLLKIEYLTFEVDVHSEAYDEVYYGLYNIRALDKDKNDLGIESDDINGKDFPLDYELDSDLGEYFYVHSVCNNTIEIKLNY